MDSGFPMRREIVFEIEQIKRIRKRAWSNVVICSECGRQADFLSLDHAAEIFEQGRDELMQFLSANHCHTRISGTEVHVCLIALLDAIDRAKDRSSIRLIGDIKK